MRRGARKLLLKAKQDPKLQTKTTKKICLVLTRIMHLKVADPRLRAIGPMHRAHNLSEMETRKTMILRTESKASRWRATRSIKRQEIS